MSWLSIYVVGVIVVLTTLAVFGYRFLFSKGRVKFTVGHAVCGVLAALFWPALLSWLMGELLHFALKLLTKKGKKR